MDLVLPSVISKMKKKMGGCSHRGAAETNPTRNHEVAGLISGLTRWVKDLVLPWAMMYVADVAWIFRCCGCGIG